MSKMYEKLQKCVSIIREKTDFVPEVALILGSGLGEYARNMDVKAEVPYSEIEGFPVPTRRIPTAAKITFQSFICRSCSLICFILPYPNARISFRIQSFTLSPAKDTRTAFSIMSFSSSSRIP